MGTVPLSYPPYDDEALVAEMMERVADLSIAVIERVLDPLDVPIDHACWWEDMAYNRGPLISPKHIKRLLVSQQSV
jgi:uroporphyrinogen decarboxylase